MARRGGLLTAGTDPLQVTGAVLQEDLEEASQAVRRGGQGGLGSGGSLYSGSKGQGQSQGQGGDGGASQSGGSGYGGAAQSGGGFGRSSVPGAGRAAAGSAPTLVISVGDTVRRRALLTEELGDEC